MEKFLRAPTVTERSRDAPCQVKMFCSLQLIRHYRRTTCYTVAYIGPAALCICVPYTSRGKKFASREGHKHTACVRTAQIETSWPVKHTTGMCMLPVKTRMTSIDIKISLNIFKIAKFIGFCLSSATLMTHGKHTHSKFSTLEAVQVRLRLLHHTPMPLNHYYRPTNKLK